MRPEERETLLALLDYSDFDGRDALLEQVDSARVDSHCGCGETIGGVIVFVDDGYLSSLEIYSIAYEPISQFPPLDRLRLFELDSRSSGT